MATEDQAIRFRETFGFPADPQTVRAARLDPVNYSSEPFGVPLSKVEIDEMFRRARIQTAMEAALVRARQSDAFAGAYLDQLDGGRPVFMFTQADPALEATLASMLPDEARLRVIGATRTERELLDLKDKMGSDLPGLAAEGIKVVRVAFNPQLNTLRIGVDGLNPTSDATLRERYGRDLVVFEDDVAQADACDHPNNCRPLKGGIAISSTSGSQWNQCTAGFIVKRNDTGKQVILTAGHCIQEHGGYNQAWYHNYDPLGRALRETFEPGSSGDADVGLIYIFSDELAAMPVKNQMRRNNGNWTTVTALASPIQGAQACRVGNTSGHDCMTITDPDAIRVSESPCCSDMTVNHVATWNEDSLPGDSGGPTFFYPGGGECCGPVTALGTHVHSETGTGANESWFSPQFWGSFDYTSAFGYSYSICLTSSC